MKKVLITYKKLINLIEYLDFKFDMKLKKVPLLIVLIMEATILLKEL